MEHTGMESRLAAPIIAISEGLSSLSKRFKRELYNPNRDSKEPYNLSNPIQVLAVDLLFAEVYLGGLLVEYEKEANYSSYSPALPRGIDYRVATDAKRLYLCERFIPEVLADAVKQNTIVSRSRVLMKEYYSSNKNLVTTI